MKNSFKMIMLTIGILIGSFNAYANAPLEAAKLRKDHGQSEEVEFKGVTSEDLEVINNALGSSTKMLGGREIKSSTNLKTLILHRPLLNEIRAENFSKLNKLKLLEITGVSSDFAVTSVPKGVKVLINGQTIIVN